MPKTIQIFLPSGDPTGIRVAEITTSVVKVIEFPRQEIEAFLKMPEAKQVGVYLLFGEDEESGEKQLYIGQSGDLSKRIAQHNQAKDFWSKAVAVVSLTNNMTQTHVLFLEWLAIREAKAVGRYQLENGNEGSKPFTPAPMEADCRAIFDITQTLLGTLGHPVFKALTAKKVKQDKLFYCRRKGVDAKGVMTDEGFVVLKGSTGNPEIPANYIGKIPSRDKLLKSGVIVIDHDRLEFVKDCLFKTPSGASNMLIGMSSNGWMEWKNQAGQTLDEIYRKTDVHEG
ncbi:MAG: GIY-YIG nuclease family protein [Thiomicrorhabdus chilensis]|uniref:GIY-YIG nuclease family protein n=1 Tax=Thiomicrorhabdus chilensis TaxID=63656 RepID=UPI00299EEC24|nr:GIY-YIG nuclease family protein [Thiomicrorhabdus chilensis]MDX1346979.1 GIY-YIG nuclease family protein [Thiomicrorhabdus chilensis]